MAKGIVKTFNAEKGYGFIRMPEEKEDIFFHYSNIICEGFKTLDANTEVEFELVKCERGLQAHSIKKI